VVWLDSKQICQISEFTNLIRVVQLVCLRGKKTVLFELRWMRACCFPCVCVRSREGVGGDGDHNGGCASSVSSLMRCHVSGSVFELLPLHLFWSQGRARYVWPYPRTWRQVLPSSPLLLCSLYPSLFRDLSLSLYSVLCFSPLQLQWLCLQDFQEGPNSRILALFRLLNLMECLMVTRGAAICESLGYDDVCELLQNLFSCSEWKRRSV